MASLFNKRIFVVEDNLENRIITQLALMRTGAHLEFDRWGRETIKLLHRQMPVDLIVLDLMFPHGVTGYDIFDQIRREAEFNHVPIVAVSAADPSEALPKCRARGFAGFISKPIEEDVFPDQLVRLMSGEKIWYTGMR
jgi:CheY-like chemotaxis protein